MTRSSSALAVCLVALSAARARAAEDPYAWLEPVHSTAALVWAQAQSSGALAALTAEPVYKPIEDGLRAVLLASDRLPEPALRGGYVYNFWQDAAHPRGLWRRASPLEYEKPEPAWDVLLDLDALAKAENENWVWEGADCLPPDDDRCLLKLSRGGRDAQVVREYDIPSGTFVEDGFTLPEAKSDTAWVDQDTLLVGTDFGPGTLTDSGYPRVIKQWSRGTPLESAKTVYEGLKGDVSVSPETDFRPEGAFTFIQRSPTFFTEQIWHLTRDGTLHELPFPKDAEFQGVFQGRALALLRGDWKTPAGLFTAGSLVSIPVAEADGGAAEADADLVYAPGPRAAFVAAGVAKSRLYVDALDEVNGKILKYARTSGGWIGEPLALPPAGTVSLEPLDPFEDRVYGRFDSFLTPPTLYTWDGTLPQDALEAVKSLPARFDAAPYAVEQLKAKSADGTEVPYFLVHRRDFKRDGKNPTLLYAYGGFEISLTPRYLETQGGAWLARGGAFALANIRGGGEFGPRWHQAALRENRQKAFDDLEAVARDLEARRVASPRTLAIQGGSNGGLLVGTVMTQTPALFGAVLCEVPLLDMLAYTRLGAGPSWIDEYGDPAEPKMAAVLASYSPYQNVKPGVRYPPVFFLTSTEDDRVQPGHARKMGAKMEGFGDSVLYFENGEGGHGAAANLEERVRERALEYTFLWKTLGKARARTIETPARSTP